MNSRDNDEKRRILGVKSTVKPMFIMFNINAPYSILNNGPNVLYGIALRKS